MKHIVKFLTSLVLSIVLISCSKNSSTDGAVPLGSLENQEQENTSDQIINQAKLNINQDVFNNILNSDVPAKLNTSLKKNLVLPLFNESVELIMNDLEVNSFNEFTWRGRVSGDPDSLVILTFINGIISAEISYQGRSLQINFSTKAESHILTEIDIFKVSQLLSDDEIIGDPNKGSKNNFKKGTPSPYSQKNSGTTVSVEFFYTSLAEQKKGAEGMLAIAKNTIAYTNDAFARSGVSTRVTFAGARRIDIVVGSNTDLYDTYKQLSQHPLAVNSAADKVQLLTHNYSNNIAGLGGIDAKISLATYRFGLFVMAHEIGHNLGCHHDESAHGGQSGRYPYSNGYFSESAKIFTLMSSSCKNCKLIPYYSNPRIKYKGHYIGKTNRADNAASIDRNPSTGPACTPEEYLRRRPDVKKAGMSAVNHYNNHGKNEAMCNPTGSDNTNDNDNDNGAADQCTPEEYLRRRPDVKSAGFSAVNHYNRHGKNEGMCNPAGSDNTNNNNGSADKCTPEEYLRRRPDVKSAGFSAVNHYNRHGKNEGMCDPR